MYWQWTVQKWKGGMIKGNEEENVKPQFRNLVKLWISWEEEKYETIFVINNCFHYDVCPRRPRDGCPAKS
jgi:hypothetical protein